MRICSCINIGAQKCDMLIHECKPRDAGTIHYRDGVVVPAPSPI
nr:MAG TPA: hypothetical protein [Herelleviridae sp.]